MQKLLQQKWPYHYFCLHTYMWILLTWQSLELKPQLVTEMTSVYVSPVLLVLKKWGETRLIVDYRKLNTQTTRKVFPTPYVDEQLEMLRGTQLFCTLDFSLGYLQVSLTERAKANTAFITPRETGQFERMIFGLVNALFEFSRLRKRIMQPLRNKVAM